MTQLTEAQRRLAMDHQRLVRHIVNRTRGCRSPKDDRLQAGMLGLIEAILDFDPSYGVKLTTYAYRRIKIAVLECECRDAKIYVPRYVRLADPKDGNTRERFDAEARRAASAGPLTSTPPARPDPPSARDVALDVRDAIRRLPIRQKRLVEAVDIAGEREVDVAESEGVTKQAIGNHRTKAFARLRASLASYAETVA